MSNTRRTKRKRTAALAELRRQSRCPDCGGTATVRRNGFDLDLHHHPGCPALVGITGTLHKDAGAAVARAAAVLDRADLAYERTGELSAIVRGGVVTGSGR